MKNIQFLSAILLASALVMTSCKKDKDGDDDHDTVPTAEIQINSPSAGHEYMAGDTVFINATVTGSATMHGWEFQLKNNADQSVIYSNDAHDHAATYTISDKWVNNLAAHTEVKLVVEATLDHDGHTAQKEVVFHCMP